MKWLCSFSLISTLLTTPTLAGTPPYPSQWPDPALPRDAFVTQMLQRMTLAEKIGQLRLISVGPDNPKDRVYTMIAEGQVGAIFNTVTRTGIRGMQDQAVRHSRMKIPLFFAYDVIHGQRTVFPISLGLAASWDRELVSTVGRVSAYEASEDGLNMTWAPMVDITRDPRWGRTSEGFGEDTYLTSEMGRLMVKAMQGRHPGDRHALMTSVKHYALYGTVEGGRDYNSVDMSPQRMFQDYLPPYKAALDAGSGGVMVSLNAINGTPASADPWLLKTLLRDQWGFQGITISDHGAIKELINHGVARDPQDAVRLAIQSGIDMSMSDEYYSQYLPGLVKSGRVSAAAVDDACRHVLNVKYDMGLFHDPYRHLGPIGSDPQDTDAESRLHRAEARTVAAQTLVLLKNRLDTLPLARRGTLAVVGPLADSQRDVIGSWSAAGKPAQAVTLLSGIRHAMANYGRVLYARGANISNDADILQFLNQYGPSVSIDPRPAQAMIDEAVAVARQADVVVAVVGEAQGMAHEASSRTHIDLPQSQRDLIAALKQTGKPLVLVLMNGRPLTLVREDQQADAILESWFPGTEGGNAVADVLFGDVNPSGKSPISFPRSVGQIPTYYSRLNTGRPYDPQKPEKYTSHYFDEANGPLYPFGYGLSYTRFTLSEITLSAPQMARNGKIEASITVTNAGPRAGATVLQLYLQDPVASISRPLKSLQDFHKVMLQPGERRRVSFTLTPQQLRFWNAQMQQVSEPGRINVFIGTDVQRVKSAHFDLL
ncbi:beta-glucosidase BglX [Edwardsiella ictaluri]|uniref:beta-glucosidase BglX n=1 Tax=Edwardsiella ictaluri TaxID=67780 RepID=UPI0039F6A74D